MDRPVEAYSNAQLKQLRTQIHNNGGKASDSLSTAKCEDCTLDPSEQRKCQTCGESKALSEFSKAQRFGGELVSISCSLGLGLGLGIEELTGSIALCPMYRLLPAF